MAAVATIDWKTETWETWGEEDLAPVRRSPAFSALTWAIALTAAYNMGVRAGITSVVPVEWATPATPG